jgi:predicted kinase
MHLSLSAISSFNVRFFSETLKIIVISTLYLSPLFGLIYSRDLLLYYRRLCGATAATLSKADFLMESAKPTLVLMAGLPGAGKSTLACALSRDLQWHVINKDSYRRVLLKQGLSDERAGRVAYELCFDTAHRVLVEQGASVILDSGALHRFILDNATDIVCSVANAQLKAILCVVDRDLRNERLRERTWPEVTNITVDPETIADYLQCFEHLPSDTLTLYTNEPFMKCLAEAKEYLRG